MFSLAQIEQLDALNNSKIMQRLAFKISRYRFKPNHLRLIAYNISQFNNVSQSRVKVCPLYIIHNCHIHGQIFEQLIVAQKWASYKLTSNGEHKPLFPDQTSPLSKLRRGNWNFSAWVAVRSCRWLGHRICSPRPRLPLPWAWRRPGDPMRRPPLRMEDPRRGRRWGWPRSRTISG